MIKSILREFGKGFGWQAITPCLILKAGAVLELEDRLGLESSGLSPWGFESPLPHINIIARL